MRTLKFIVENQHIDKDSECDFSNIVSGTSGYLVAEFATSQEWDGCRVIATFSKLPLFDHMAVESVPLIHGKCTIPDSVLKSRKFTVQLTGINKSYMITTDTFLVNQEG